METPESKKYGFTERELELISLCRSSNKKLLILCAIFSSIAFVTLLFQLYEAATLMLPKSGTGLSMSILLFIFCIVISTTSLANYRFNKILKKIFPDNEQEELNLTEDQREVKQALK